MSLETPYLGPLPLVKLVFGVFFVLFCCSISALDILGTNPVLDMWLANIVFHSAGCLSTSLFPLLCGLQLGVVPVVDCLHLVSKSLPGLTSRSLPAIFSSWNAMVPGLMLKCLIHSELISMYGVRSGSSGFYCI